MRLFGGFFRRIAVVTVALAVLCSMATASSMLRVNEKFDLHHEKRVQRKALISSDNNNNNNNNNENIPSCSDFDAKKVKLVTFDVFAALMDLSSSLTRSVHAIVPTLTNWQVDTLVNTWIGDYSSYAGAVFDQRTTGASPFQWVLRSSLDNIIAEMKLTVTSTQYEALVAAWGQLTPWPGTEKVLAQLHSANFTIAALSNGDHNTLIAATSVFNASSPFSAWFSSDFPVGAFKPDEAMYKQVLQTISAENHLHVAGASADGWGGRRAGMFSALLGSTPLPQPPYPCFVLKDISELPAVLGL